MSNFVSSAKKFIEREDAPSMREYGLLAALIAIVAFVAVATLGKNVKGLLAPVAGSV